MTEHDTHRLLNWFCARDTGASSKAIALRMGGVPAAVMNERSTPSDVADLGRCLRLLALFPDWKNRFSEMADVSPRWRAILPHWDQAAALMAEEVGIDWSKGQKAPQTYAFMKSKGF